MSLLITIISFVVVLGVLVFFHELGHYWVARRHGIEVEEFGMGYPPRIIKLFTYDRTDFTINLIPFGGFARMKGEDGADLSKGSFNAASRWARASTLIAGPAMNALLAIVLFAASFMAGFPASVAYPQLTAVPADSVAATLGLQAGDLLLQADDRPILLSSTPDLRYDVWQADESTAATTLTISRAGEIIQLPVTTQQTVVDLLKTISYEPVLDTQIVAVAVDSPAHLQGLVAGDLIYQVSGAVVTYDKPLNVIVQENLDREIPVTIYRDGEWLTLNVTPRSNPPAGEGALGVQISSLTRLATLPVLQSLWQGVISTVQYVGLVLQLPILLLMGQLSPAEAQISGPVGIAQMVGGAVSASIDTGLMFPIWRLSAVLSAALAITNLLPLPALDGGRLVFILIETLRGRRINPEREGLVHMVGFMLLLGLMVYITVQDLRTGTMAIDWHSLLGQ